MSNLIIEGVKSEIENGLSNIIGYNFLQTVFSNHQAIQKKRAEEFLEFMKKHEQKFTVELINNECFVSGLSLTLKEVIKQYSDLKRAKIYSIFLGFTDSKDKEDFELEKMCNILNLLSFDDLEVLKKIEEEIFISYEDQEKPDFTSSLFYLNSLGFFRSPTVWGGNKFILTDFGLKFQNYIFQYLNNNQPLINSKNVKNNSKQG